MAKPKKRRSKSRKAIKLSAKERKFCQHYFENNNARQAYIFAKLPGKHPSDPHDTGSIDVMASRLLKKVKANEYFKKLEDDACAAADITIEWLSNRYKSAEQADIAKLFDRKTRQPLHPLDWPDEIRLHVIKIEPVESWQWVIDSDGKKKKILVGTAWKVQLENKTECRNMLAKWKRMFADDRELERLGVEIDEVRRSLTVSSNNENSKNSGGTQNGTGGTVPEVPADTPDPREV